MSKEANIKNQQKLKVYLSKKNDTQPNTKKDKRLRNKPSAN
jgi:hypothetical protein